VRQARKPGCQPCACGQNRSLFKNLSAGGWLKTSAIRSQEDALTAPLALHGNRKVQKGVSIALSACMRIGPPKIIVTGKDGD